MSRIWNKANNGTQSSSSEDILITQKKNTSQGIYSSIEALLGNLSEEIRIYTLSCLDEHQVVIQVLQTHGYVAVELCFRDYLSWPHNEIAGNNTALLEEAFHDARYELVPMIVFSNTKIENSEDNTAETSSLFIEFHKRGMAF